MIKQSRVEWFRRVSERTRPRREVSAVRLGVLVVAGVLRDFPEQVRRRGPESFFVRTHHLCCHLLFFPLMISHTVTVTANRCKVTCMFHTFVYCMFTCLHLTVKPPFSRVKNTRTTKQMKTDDAPYHGSAAAPLRRVVYFFLFFLFFFNSHAYSARLKA